jgi:hypothetical protein
MIFITCAVISGYLNFRGGFLGYFLLSDFHAVNPANWNFAPGKAKSPCGFMEIRFKFVSFPGKKIRKLRGKQTIFCLPFEHNEFYKFYEYFHG